MATLKSLANYALESAPLHRQKVIQNLLHKSSPSVTEGLVFLQGGRLQNRQWTDVELPFRQESYFFYLTGVEEPDCQFLMDISSGSSYLLVPSFPADHALWCGQPLSPSDFKVKYGMTNCFTVNEWKRVLELHPQSKSILVLESTELKDHPLSSALSVETTRLKQALIEARVYKTPGEIELMRHAAEITRQAHVSLMKSIGKGEIQNERQGHALFHYECFKNGAPFQAYTPIVAAGKAGSTLHYIQNNAPFPSNKSSLFLVDAGCEYSCYASDVTRTYPLNGKFEKEYKTLYEIVLKCQLTVLKELKVGVEWEDMHRLASRVILQGLLDAQIVQGDFQTLEKHHVHALFFPHGLGHLIGLDVHDVGGYPPGVERIQEPGIKYLRMRRKLEPGMVVTVEPGVYFVDAILEPALKDPHLAQYLNVEVLNKYRDLGGVRIEDDVVILENGILNLTESIPKTISDIEKIMSIV